MSKLSIENDELLEELLLTVPAPPPSDRRILPAAQKNAAKVESSWEGLGLKFEPKWPLHILFTQSVLEKSETPSLSIYNSFITTRYNTLFKILLAIRRAQIALQHCWYLEMSKRKRTAGLLWQLRIHMSFLIDNLQYYVQVWRELLVAI